jgi:hypothetical protein
MTTHTTERLVRIVDQLDRTTAKLEVLMEGPYYSDRGYAQRFIQCHGVADVLDCATSDSDDARVAQVLASKWVTS